MNILIFSWRDIKHPNAGGAEISTHEHAKGWVSAGHKVFHFSAHFKGAKRKETIEGVQYLRHGVQYFGVQVAGFCWYFFGRHGEIDLVVDQFHGIPFFTPIYVRTKKLGFIHEVTKEIWLTNPWPKPYNKIPALIGTVFEPFVFKILYRNIPFMTVSKSTKKDLLDWRIPEDQITVINNGANLLSTKRKKEKSKTLIYLGALAMDKGIEDAIEVFAKIYKSNKDWQFWVVGMGAKGYLEALKEKTKLLKLKNIKFWGFVSEKKKFELLGGAHLMINPSAREGWGLVNIEANSVGTPVIGYRVAGIRDSVVHGKTGLLVEKGDIQAMAKSTIDLLKNEKKYKDIQTNAEAWSKKFTWRKSTQASTKLIEALGNYS